MDNKVLFIILNNQIHYSQDPKMDHKELYNYFGGDPNNYEKIIRGFIYKDKIIFFKYDLSYDKEVIDMACKCAPLIKEQFKNPYLKVCCGINPGQNGSSWEPIMTLNDNELTGFTANNQENNKDKELERQQRIEAPNEAIIEFKNNYEDPKFIKFATIFTIVIIVLSVISKVIISLTRGIDFSGWLLLLLVSQFVLLILTIVGYLKKLPSAKYIGIAASLSIIFMFNIFDVIIGIINLLFTIDQGYILKAITAGKKAKNAIGKNLTKDKEKDN